VNDDLKSLLLLVELFLSCTHTLTSAAIQFSFGTNLPTGDEAVAASLGGTQTIFLPVVVNIEPSTALLQSDIVDMESSEHCHHAISAVHANMQTCLFLRTQT